MEIQAAAKDNDVATALAAFDRAKRDGIRISPDLYINLLYLCSGGDRWERQLSTAGEDGEQEQEAAAAAAADASARGGAAAADGDVPAAGERQEQVAATAPGENGSAAAAEGAAPPATAPAVEQPPPEEVARRAVELFAEMEQSKGKLGINEMCYTAMARLAALQGDADRAFELVQVGGRLRKVGLAAGRRGAAHRRSACLVQASPDVSSRPGCSAANSSAQDVAPF